MYPLIPEWINNQIIQWFQEDIPYLDPAMAVFPEELTVKAVAKAKTEGIIAGIPVVKKIYEYVGVNFESVVNDGDQIKRGKIIYIVEGNVGSVLRAERLALNVLTHLSGIATQTKKAVKKLESLGVNTKVAATRKTLPGLRTLQKYAVIVGGGYPHRFGLSEVVMLKDNHREYIGNLKQAIAKIRSMFGPQMVIEVESKSFEEAIIAAESGANIIMLDNFSPKKAKEAAKELKSQFPQVIIEVSGGITIENIQEYGDNNIDYVSMGALTHTIRPLDISCKIVRE